MDIRENTTIELELSAYESQQLPAEGNSFYVSEADAAVEIGPQGRGKVQYKQSQGYNYRMDNEAFTFLSIKNTSGSTNNVRIEVGYGDFIDNTSTINGSIQASQPSGETYKVDDDQTQAALGDVNDKLDTANTNLGDIEADIEATNTALTATNNKLDDVNTNLAMIDTEAQATSAELVEVNTKLDTANTNLGDIEADIEATNALLQNGTDQRLGFVDTTGHSTYTAVNTTTTVITALANTGGFLIMGGSLWDNGAGTCGIRVDGNYIYHLGTGHGLLTQPLFIEAGKSIDLVSDSSTQHVYLFGKAL